MYMNLNFTKSAGLLIVVALLFVAFLMTGVDSVFAFEEVWVLADEITNKIELKEAGFLHGIESGEYLEDSLVALLKPLNWRLYKFATLDYARRFNPKITYGISNHYAWSHGGFPYAHPWEDWEEYENFILEELILIAAYFPDVHIEFYDIWNEPDHPYFWTGTYSQLLELFARAHDIIKLFDPGAKLVGPSVSRFDPDDPGVANVVGFLTDLDRGYGVRLDAVSWHENGGAFEQGPRPEHIPNHAGLIRSGIRDYFPPEYQPELHVNEYAGGRVHLSPGWNVGYLYYLGEARIDGAGRACWWVFSGDNPPYDYWSDCWAGLNGMFMRDGITPQPSYWVYRAYAEMEDTWRVQTFSSEPTTVVIASENSEEEEFNLIAGRYWHIGAEQVIIYVEDYPFLHDMVNIAIEKIPHFPEFFEDPPIAQPLPDGPIPIAAYSQTVLDSSLVIIIDYFENGDVYLINIKENETTDIVENYPSTPAHHSTVLRNIPNPFNSVTIISFELVLRTDVCLTVYNLLGQKIDKLLDQRMNPGNHNITWDASTYSNGIYFYQLEIGNKTITKRMTLLK
ncbi:MAG: T9SS type A sorting domain-containing protein [candidate division Zixibacteria bacterium]|nr:T9SS type A sorting domain-containing protein [candidate division Zixibacteria bacterium]